MFVGVLFLGWSRGRVWSKAPASRAGPVGVLGFKSRRLHHCSGGVF